MTEQRTSATVPDDVDEGEVPHLPTDPPPAPGWGQSAFLFMTCAIYALIAALGSASAFSLFGRPLRKPMDLVGHGIFTLGPLLILVFSSGLWREQVRSRAADSSRWLAALLPGAVLAGILGGAYIAARVFPPEDRLEVYTQWSVDVCGDLATKDDMRRCVNIADECQREVLAGPNTWSAFESCAAERFKP